MTDVVGEENEDGVEDRGWSSIERVWEGDEQGGKMSRGQHVQAAGQSNEVW